MKLSLLSALLLIGCVKHPVKAVVPANCHPKTAKVYQYTGPCQQTGESKMRCPALIDMEFYCISYKR